MHERSQSIKYHLKQGIPFEGMDENLPREAFEEYTLQAEDASLVAHETLYDMYSHNDRRVAIFDDNDSHEQGKFLSFYKKDGTPSFLMWDPDHSATDIGIRALNPSFHGTANPTTVIHADTEASRDAQTWGLPHEATNAIEAVARLNDFITTHVVQPYLEQVANLAGINREEYLGRFIDRQRRLRILTRIILYHAEATPEQRPVGSDGTPLLIKEHHDRSSWTVDVKQTAPGLQYKKDDEWNDASTKLSVFRGAADSYLPFEAPPALHRAVVRDFVPEHKLAKAGIARIAIPTFVSPLGKRVRVVTPSSHETHPTGTNYL